MSFQSYLQPLTNFCQKGLKYFAQALAWIGNKFPSEISARYVLMFCVMTLLSIGTIMVASASMPYAESIGANTPYFFVIRHVFAIIFAFACAYFCYTIKDTYLFENTVLIYLIALFALLLVLVIGIEKNGSTRWLNLGIMNFQPTELAKVAMAIFMADYVVRRDKEVKSNFGYSLTRLSIAFGLMVLLIAAEPDLGAAVVIGGMALGIFYLAGAPIKQFLYTTAFAVVVIAIGVLSKSYRLERLLSFTRPFEDQYGSGYQLSNSLMAYGLGDWTGVGLGQSVQKLSYLPEAHTDFMLAILGEEFGFVGVAFILILSFTMAASCMVIGQNALKKNYLKAGYLAYAVSLIFVIQIVVNVGMTLGMLPTKGLTLPFISYGGSSLWACAVMVGLVLQVDKKTRINHDPSDVIINFKPSEKKVKKARAVN